LLIIIEITTKLSEIFAIELDVLMFHITSDNQELTNILNFKFLSQSGQKQLAKVKLSNKFNYMKKNNNFAKYLENMAKKKSERKESELFFNIKKEIQKIFT
jgi:hypothetical protein